MLDERRHPDWIKKHEPQDVLASSIRSALSVFPAGGILSEFLTQLIPRQRLDRLQEFTEAIAESVEDLKEFKDRLSDSPGFSALTEQTVLAAVQTASTQRRRELAELLRTGLSKTESEMVEHDSLLRLLTQLNDAQVLILASFGNFARGSKDHEEFMASHPHVFPHPPKLRAASDSIRPWTMFQHYESQLLALGLLKDTEGVAKSEGGRLEITALGRLLLEAIGRSRPAGQ